MRPVDLEGRNVILGADQPQYIPLYARVLHDEHGSVVTEWELTAEELTALLAGARIRLTTLTFGHLFQPIKLEVIDP